MRRPSGVSAMLSAHAPPSVTSYATAAPASARKWPVFGSRSRAFPTSSGEAGCFPYCSASAYGMRSASSSATYGASVCFRYGRFPVWAAFGGSFGVGSVWPI